MVAPEFEFDMNATPRLSNKQRLSSDRRFAGAQANNYYMWCRGSAVDEEDKHPIVQVLLDRAVSRVEGEKGGESTLTATRIREKVSTVTHDGHLDVHAYHDGSYNTLYDQS